LENAGVLIVDCQELSAIRLASQFRAHTVWKVRIAGDRDTALARFAESAPELVILHCSLSGFEPDGLQLCRKLRSISGNTSIVVLTRRSGILDKLAAFEAGADDYMVEPFDVRELMARVAALARRAHLGERVRPDPVDVSPLGTLEASLDRAECVADCVAQAAALRFGLTSRQRQVLSLVLRGRANKEIAEALTFSTKNAEYHLAQLLRKMGCSCRVELIAHLMQDSGYRRHRDRS
jgi:DNA-binding NarL/FixJ family response regulator